METTKMKVYLNVYELLSFEYWNGYLIPLGCGAYHSGVEVFHKEYSYGYNETNATGVFHIIPKTAYGCAFRESILIGETNYSSHQVENMIKSMESEYMGNVYNIYSKNCNHFTRDLCLKLTGNKTPSFVNRLAFVGNIFKCFVPLESNGSRRGDDTEAQTVPTSRNTSSSHDEQDYSSSSYDDDEDLQRALLYQNSIHTTK